jgi:hypothetical protein
MLSKISPNSLLKQFQLGKIALSWSVVIFALLLIVFVALRLWHITTYSLWGGEAFTMIGVQQSWSDMFAYIAADIVHPPLIYILLKLWIMIGGESVLWLKLFSVIPGIAVVVPFLLLCRQLKFRLPETNLALLLLTFNGYLVHYAQELRMYSLFMFLALCSFWLFMRLFNTPGRAIGQLIVLTGINLLAIFTHYYGWVVVGMEFLFILIWQRRRTISFALSMVFLLLCFAPWAYVVVREARAIGGLDQNLDWIPKPRLTNIANLYVTFNGPLGNRFVKLFGLLVFAFPILAWAWQLVRTGLKQQKDDLHSLSWLAMLAFLPVVALFVVSQQMDQAVWMDRYFIFIAIPYMMLVAAAAFRLKPAWLRNLWIAVIVLMSSLAGYNDWRTNRMAWESPQLGSRMNWDDLVRRMMAAETKTSGPINIYSLTVISNGYRTGDWAISTSIDYFLDMYGDNRFQVVYVRDAQVIIDEVDDDYFWVAFFKLTEWPVLSPAVVFNEHGYLVGDPITYQKNNESFTLLPVQRK